MNDSFQIFLIIITLLIVVTFIVLFSKYFLFPLFFKPKLDSRETYSFFEKENLYFIEQRPLKKSEIKINPFNNKKGFSLIKIFSEKSEYLAVTTDKTSDGYIFFWIELVKFHTIFIELFSEMVFGQKYKNRTLTFKEVTNKEVLIELREEFEPKIKLILNTCPACNNKISSGDLVCLNCDLSLKF